MAKKDPYVEFLKEDFTDLFGQLDLTPVQRKFLSSRWLDQVLWMEKKANTCRDRHYRLRLSAIVLGVIVPILIGINVNDENRRLRTAIDVLTISMSATVAVCAAVEEFFHYGERWYHYRRTVESLKTYGWQFSQLSGRYSKYPNHAAAFPDFSNQVEEVIQRDVEVYVTQVAKSEDDDGQSVPPMLPAALEPDSSSDADEHPLH